MELWTFEDEENFIKNVREPGAIVMPGIHERMREHRQEHWPFPIKVEIVKWLSLLFATRKVEGSFPLLFAKFLQFLGVFLYAKTARWGIFFFHNLKEHIILRY